MSKRTNDSNDLSDILKQFVEENSLQKGLDKVNVEKAWTDLLGKGIANYTKKVSLRNDTLLVELTSSVVREELSYGKQKIIKMINESLGKEIVKDIIFR